VANAAKVQTALKLSQEDQNTIGSLKREIEKAWKMVDSAHEKVITTHHLSFIRSFRDREGAREGACMAIHHRVPFVVSFVSAVAGGSRS